MTCVQRVCARSLSRGAGDAPRRQSAEGNVTVLALSRLRSNSNDARLREKNDLARSQARARDFFFSFRVVPNRTTTTGKRGGFGRLGVSSAFFCSLSRFDGGAEKHGCGFGSGGDRDTQSDSCVHARARNVRRRGRETPVGDFVPSALVPTAAESSANGYYEDIVRGQNLRKFVDLDRPVQELLRLVEPVADAAPNGFAVDARRSSLHFSMRRSRPLRGHSR